MNFFPWIILCGLILTFVYPTAINDESAIEKGAYPWYSSIMLSVQGIFAYFNQQSPVWVKVAWWGAFVAEDGGVMDSVEAVKTACDSCKANHKDPPGGDCTTDAIDAVKSVLMNVVTLSVGWNAPGAVNGVMIDGQHKRSLREEGIRVFSAAQLPVISFPTI